nr:hypothetical protein CFP56_31564 [Quercus suber]
MIITTVDQRTNDAPPSQSIRAKGVAHPPSIASVHGTTSVTSLSISPSPSTSRPRDWVALEQQLHLSSPTGRSLHLPPATSVSHLNRLKQVRFS